MPSIRSILSLAPAYRMFWRAVGGPQALQILFKEYGHPKAGDRVLDIGCGPGTIVPYLPKVDYVGFDISPAYIESARRRFPSATFVCERVSAYSLPACSFDLVLALGIVHHLGDAEAVRLFEIARGALKPGCKLVTFDGVLTSSQSNLARYLVGQDRGEFVRNEEAYARIASQVFSCVKLSVRHDLLRIPYSHIILECQR